MLRKKTPPEYGLSSGPTMVACQWNWSFSVGPAEQLAGGSFCKSASSFWILFWAIQFINPVYPSPVISPKNSDVILQKSSDRSPSLFYNNTSGEEERGCGAWVVGYNYLRIRRIMIKQYDFPRIFQNVVGEVIPCALRNKENRRVEQPVCLSSSSSHTLEQEETNRLYVQSRRKKLVRRHKATKTSACLALTRQRSEQDKNQEQPSSRRNFAKKKQYTLQRSDKQSPRKPMKLSDQNKTVHRYDDQINSSLPDQSSKPNKNSIRLRTSIEETEREAPERTRKEMRKVKQRVSQASAKSDVKMVPTVRSKTKYKTFFKLEPKDTARPGRPSFKFADQQPKSVERKRTAKMKKTVNFFVGSENSSRGLVPSRNQLRINKQAKRGTRVNVGKTPHSSRRLLDETSSKWSARSVVSIKFSNNRIRSKKSLRSEESILAAPNNGFITKTTNAGKRRYATKTFVRFSDKRIASLKKCKSLTGLSQVSIDIGTEWQLPISKRSIKVINTNLGLKSSRSIKKTKPALKGSVLIKSGDPYLLRGESVRSIETMRNSNFQDMVFKKSALNMFSTGRTTTDPDIFTELNNFQKYLKDNEAEQDQDIQRVQTKPIVLQTNTQQRVWVNRRLLSQQSLLIDMGLTLVKKMCILKQKRY